MNQWNAENYRKLTLQEEQLAKYKSTEQMMKEQDRKFEEESKRIQKGWHKQKSEYELHMKTLTRKEVQVLELERKVANLKAENTMLKKEKGSNTID